MTANIEEKIELNEQTPLKSDIDALATTDEATGNENVNVGKSKEIKKNFKLFSFSKSKNGKQEEGAVVAPYEKEIDNVETKPEKVKKSWWNCNKKCGQQQEEGNQQIDVNLIQRDNHNLQTAIDLTYEEVYGEPFNLHSFNAVWNLNTVIFNCVRSIFYKLFSLIVVIPLAILFGILFAFTSVLSVFFCIPAGRLFSIPANWILKLWNFIISGIFDPVFYSIGHCFGNVKISRYGINSDPTTILTA